MSFEKIGPYELTRGDLIAASLVISFLIGGRSARIAGALLTMLGLLIIGFGLFSDNLEMIGIGLIYIPAIFLLGPALRSRKGSRNIYLDYSPEGLVAETPSLRTTYKWSTISTVRKIGSRLFIMISDGCALVISDRTTSPDNMDRLMATIAAHREPAGRSVL